jgi:hypothetical protein
VGVSLDARLRDPRDLARVSHQQLAHELVGLVIEPPGVRRGDRTPRSLIQPRYRVRGRKSQEQMATVPSLRSGQG